MLEPNKLCICLSGLAPVGKPFASVGAAALPGSAPADWLTDEVVPDRTEADLCSAALVADGRSVLFTAMSLLCSSAAGLATVSFAADTAEVGR